MNGLKWMLAAVLGMAGTAMGGTYYVATTGSDTSPGDGSSANPWATINKAIDTCTGTATIYVANGTYHEADSVGDNRFIVGSSQALKTITLRSSSGNADDVIINPTSGGADDGSYGFYFTATSGSFTFRDVTLRGNYTSRLAYCNGTSPVYFYNCKILNTDRINGQLFMIDKSASSTQPDFYFSGCTLSAFGNLMYQKGGGTVTATSCTAQWYDNCTAFRLEVAPEKLVLNDVTWDYQGDDDHQYAACFDKAGTTLTGYVPVEFTNCKGTTGVIHTNNSAETVGTYLGPVTITGNAVTMKYVGTVAHFLYFGIEVTGSGCQASSGDAHPVKQLYIANNAFTYSGSQASHTLFLGVGCNDSVVLNNTFTTTTSATAYGIVVKGDRNLIAYNRVIHPSITFDLAGGSGNHILNNTFVASNGYAGVIDVHQDWDAAACTTSGLYGAPRENLLMNNIFLGSSGSYALAYDETGNNVSGDTQAGTTYYWDNFLDYNVYYADGTNDVSFLNNWVTLPTAWQTNFQGISYFNDAHSSIADPKIVGGAVATYDWRVKDNSSALKTGFPTGATIGGSSPGAGRIGVIGVHGTFGPE